MKKVQCQRCKGLGMIITLLSTKVQVECPNCKGTGEVEKEKYRFKDYVIAFIVMGVTVIVNTIKLILCIPISIFSRRTFWEVAEDAILGYTDYSEHVYWYTKIFKRKK